MGLLSWWRGNKSQSPATRPGQGSDEVSVVTAAEAGAVPGMHGAEEVRRPNEVTVFEFGSAAATGDRITMAGYCPVSEELEPCRWTVIPAKGSDAPQFRVVF